MFQESEHFLCQRYPAIAAQIKTALARVQAFRHSSVALINQERVLSAFTENRVASYDLLGSTGYGYNDQGREKLEAIYAQVFGGQAALGPPQISSAPMPFGWPSWQHLAQRRDPLVTEDPMPPWRQSSQQTPAACQPAFSSGPFPSARWRY